MLLTSTGSWQKFLYSYSHGSRAFFSFFFENSFSETPNGFTSEKITVMFTAGIGNYPPQSAMDVQDTATAFCMHDVLWEIKPTSAYTYM
jgi:hypothetical protein